MYGPHRIRSERRVYELPALATHAELSSQERLRRGRTQANKDLRSHNSQFGVEPRAASLNFGVARLFVNAPFAPFGRRPLEMFHHVRHVYFCSINASLDEGLIQEFPRRPNKRMTSPILLISRLLADEHDLSRRGSFTEDGLSSVPPEVTGLAACSRLPQLLNSASHSCNIDRTYAGYPKWRFLRPVGNLLHFFVIGPTDMMRTRGPENASQFLQGGSHGYSQEEMGGKSQDRFNPSARRIVYQGRQPNRPD